MSDHPMDSGDSDDEHDALVRKEHHGRNRREAGSRENQRQEASVEEARASSANQSSYRSEHEDQRTSHGGLQMRSQVTPKRHVRSIPGRFSALDSDDEEEWFRQYDMEQVRTAFVNTLESATMFYRDMHLTLHFLIGKAKGTAGGAGHERQ